MAAPVRMGAPNNSIFTKRRSVLLSQRKEFGRIAILFGVWGLLFLDRMSVLYLAPYLARDLHLGSSQVGELAAALSFSWALSSLCFGVVSDRVGRKVVLVPSMLLFSALALACGAAHSFTQLLCLRLLMGFCGGPVATTLFALVEQSSDPARRGRNAGIVMSAAALVGRAIAPVLSTQVATHLGWRWALVLVGSPGILLALLALVFVSDPRRSDEAGQDLQRAHRAPALRDLISIMRYRNVWLACAGAAGMLSWLFVFNTFGGLYLVQAQHYELTTAGWVIGWVGLGGFIQSLIYPSFSDRFGRRRMLLLMTGFCVLIPVLFSSGALAAHPGLLALLGFLANAGEGAFALFLILVPAESVPTRQAGAAIGLTMLMGELIGGTLMPGIAGRLAQQYGLGATLWVAAAGALLAVLATLALRRPSPPTVRAGQPDLRAA
jgi:MFS family permease